MRIDTDVRQAWQRQLLIARVPNPFCQRLFNRELVGGRVSRPRLCWPVFSPVLVNSANAESQEAVASSQSNRVLRHAHTTIKA